MTIRHLTVFAAVAEQGSMSAAANIFIFPSQQSVRPSVSWKLIITAFSLKKALSHRTGKASSSPCP